MEVKLAVLADYASITQEGKLNILGIFDEINTRELPARLPIFYVVVSYRTTASEFGKTKVVEVALQDADGNVSVRIQQSVEIPRPARPGMRGTVNQVHGLAMLPWPRTGQYEFSISVDGHPIGQIPIVVNEPTGGPDGGT